MLGVPGEHDARTECEGAAVGVELAITDYKLTLIPRPPPDGGQITVELERILHDPVFVEEELGHAVSVRDQLSVVLRPPTATVIDHNGASPARSEMVVAAVGLIEMVEASGFSVQEYGWNIQGVLSGVDPRETMSRLVDAQRLADVLGKREEAWSVSLITLSTDAGMADATRINVALQVVVEPDGQESLRFDANAHYERAPDIGHRGDEGPRVWAGISDIFGRLPG